MVITKIKKSLILFIFIFTSQDFFNYAYSKPVRKNSIATKGHNKKKSKKSKNLSGYPPAENYPFLSTNMIKTTNSNISVTGKIKFDLNLKTIQNLTSLNEQQLSNFLKIRAHDFAVLAKDKPEIHLSKEAMSIVFDYYYKNLSCQIHESDKSWSKYNEFKCNDHLSNKINNHRYIFIADFSVDSSTPRGALLDLAEGAIGVTIVAIGNGSDPNDTDNPHNYRFGNNSGENTTALGISLTDNEVRTFIGHDEINGRYETVKLHIDGQESSNEEDNLKRAHGAPYCNLETMTCRRSEGCSSIPREYAKDILTAASGGAPWFHYAKGHPINFAKNEFYPSYLDDNRSTETADSE